LLSSRLAFTTLALSALSTPAAFCSYCWLSRQRPWLAVVLLVTLLLLAAEVENIDEVTITAELESAFGEHPAASDGERYLVSLDAEDV
jgi:hypothetical protein